MPPPRPPAPSAPASAKVFEVPKTDLPLDLAATLSAAESFIPSEVGVKRSTPAKSPLDLAKQQISESVPRASDPAIKQAAEAIAHQISPRMSDPEMSLDIPPPADVTPPEDREAGAKDPYIGTTFDHRYKIQKLLGEGGMGFVYLARHKVIDKKVAVKVLRADLAKDREILDRFLQEAKAASSIGNPHIIDISDFGDLPDGSTYFVMEFLEGQSLGAVLEAGPRLPVDRICHIALQIADGLSAAHERGIVHRDLKPDNIFVVTRGTDHDFVKILDFGIAKVSGDASSKLTKAGAVFGTPHYMSPEQAAGAPIDHRTDIYALGVMLYEMVSGQLPFNADNFMGILTQHMYKAPVPIRALVPGPECPPSLEAVVLKCLSKKAEARYQSMDELAADLKKVREGAVPGAVAEMMARSGGFNVPHDYFKTPASVMVPATPPTSTKPARYVWIAGAAAAVAIVTAIFVVGGIVNSSPPPKPETSATVAVAPPPVTATASAAPPPPEVKKVAVAVAATPKTAQGFRDDKPFKLPATIDVEEGKKVTIDIRADGYEPVTLDLDGSEQSKLVELKLKAPKGVPGKTPAVPTKTPSKGVGHDGIVDPWNH
ncbi:MAG: serine/threonine-protein kinase [Byssovorax sp.]